MPNDEPLQVTSRYGARVRNGQEEFHPGTDFVSWDLVKYVRLPILTPERISVIAFNYDSSWGGILKMALLDHPEMGSIRYVHIMPLITLEQGREIQAGKIVGYSMATAFMKSIGAAEHLHVEAYDVEGKIYDPLIYYDALKIKYKDY